MTKPRTTLEHEVFDPDDDDATRTATKASQATTIIRLVTDANADLWHTPSGNPYISIQSDHVEHHPLGGRMCRDYLARLYYLETGKAPNATALQDAVTTLSGMARFDGDVHPVHVRVAGDGSSRVYLDLCDDLWRAVEITSAGWQVVTHPPVRFRRAKGMLPLPMPARGGSLVDLRPFVNVATNNDFALIAAWLLAAVRPRGPYPILIFVAEQGTAKTTTTRALRRVIDPNESDVRRPPRNTEDLMIAASNGHVVAFDNLSRLTDELSDNLSVLATGGGFAVRMLFTNDEERIFNAQKPIILNGIAQAATRGDLLDRAIVSALPPIPDDRRKDEQSFWADFVAAHPKILGAVLDAVVMGLRRLPFVSLDRKPRMADFALWGVAVESGCPWTAGTFLKVYAGNRQGAIEVTLDGDPVVDAVRKIAPWSGTAAELLQVVTEKTPENITKRKDWFTKPRQVADELRRLAPGLRRTGIDVVFRREAQGRRTIVIERVGPESSPSSPASPDAEFRTVSGDESGDAGPASSPVSSPSSPASSPRFPNDSGLSDAGDAGDAVEPPISTFQFDPTTAFVRDSLEEDLTPTNYAFQCSDGGRSLSRRPKEKKDCTVRALAIVTGAPYDEVYEELARDAYRFSNRGMLNFDRWIYGRIDPAIGDPLYVFGWTATRLSFPARRGERRMNPPTFAATFPTGRYIVQTAKHVNAVIDGIAYDTGPTYPERCIYAAWHFTKVADHLTLGQRKENDSCRTASH